MELGVTPDVSPDASPLLRPVTLTENNPSSETGSSSGRMQQLSARKGESDAEAATEEAEEDDEADQEPDPLKRTVRKSAADFMKYKTDVAGWKKTKEKGGITLLTRAIAGTNSLGVKVTAIFPFPAKVVFEVLMDPKTQFDKSTDYKVLEDLGDNMRLTYTRVPVPLFSDSDFLCGEWQGMRGDNFIYSFTSVEHPSHLPSRKLVRGKIIVGGWLVAPRGAEECEVTMVSICDPCRSVPSALANSSADKSGKSVATLRKLVQKHLEG